MSAELSSNTYQAYQPFYDQLASGWGVPQETGARLKEITNCQKFVLKVQEIARGSKDLTDFLDSLANTFLNVNNSSLEELQRANNMVGLSGANEYVNNSGIRQEFRGPTDEGAQIRHLVAELIISTAYGLSGEWFMDDRETPTQPASLADIHVNSLVKQLVRDLGLKDFTVSNGRMIGNMPLIRKSLANEIRKRFCEY